MAGRWATGIGAEFRGRTTIGPQRGPWTGLGTEEEWRGRWGEEPEGGTTFRVITASPTEALEPARAAAGGLAVRIGGGPSTVRRFLAADLVDRLHVALVHQLRGDAPRPRPPLTAQRRVSR